MKIAILGQKGIPSTSGGVEIHVEELSTRLARAGHDVLVYARPNYTDPKLKEYKKVKIINLPSIGTKHLDAISHTFRACLDVSRRQVDIIHFHSIGPSSLIWLARILNPGIPIVATFHSQCYRHQKWGVFAKIYLRFGEWMACKMADETITVSRALEQYAKNKYKKSNISYIPNGVTLPRTCQANFIKKQWNLDANSYILTVSRLIKHKGLHHLINAYKGLETDKKLVIVGDGVYTGDYVDDLHILAQKINFYFFKNNINKEIIFTGRQEGKALQELFSNAHLFVQPSEEEGLSIALLEAMAYNISVLVSDIPANKEAIGYAGFIFKNKNVSDLADQLEYLLSRPEMLTKMGDIARLRVAQEYDWKNITRKIVNTYEEMMAIKQVKNFNLSKFSLVRILNIFF